jgi:hypothetical protein
MKGKTYAALALLLYMLVSVFAPAIDKGVAPSDVELVHLGIGVSTVLAVYFVPLVPGHTWIKSALGAILAGLGVLTTAVVGGVTVQEWMDVAAYVLGSLGILVAPATSDTGVAVGVGGDAPLN